METDQMTPTPEQNAKRETPRCDAAEAELERWIAAEEDGTEPPSILDLARTLETELQQLRLAADGMAAVVEAEPHHISCRYIPSGHGVEPEPCNCWKSKALAAYRAAGEGSPKDTGTSRE